MRKLTLATAMLASLGGAIVTTASAAPGAPMGVAAPETVTHVRMDRMERHMMRRHMEHRMMRRRMMRREMMHRM